MKTWLKIATLIVSHAGVFVAVAAGTGGYLVAKEFRRAEEDPLSRLGMRSEVTPDVLYSFPSIESDVRAGAAKLDPATQRALQLGAELRANDMTGATRTCGDLGWSDCEPAALNEMQKALLK